MPTATPLHRRLHLPPHRRRPQPPSLHHRAPTRCRRLILTRTRTHRERMTPRRATTPRPGATPRPPGATTPRREAMTRRGPMRRRRRAHTIHREHTQRPETTPPPHRMSRQPHTGNPRPSAMITLTTRQSPLIDRCSPPITTLPTLPLSPPKQSLHTADLCVCACMFVCAFTRGTVSVGDQV